jgi:hypothetical protein
MHAAPIVTPLLTQIRRHTPVNLGLHVLGVAFKLERSRIAIEDNC